VIDTPSAAGGGLSSCRRRRQRADDRTEGCEPTGSDEKAHWPGYCVGFDDAGIALDETPDSQERP
jgi:hypothetical protein